MIKEFKEFINESTNINVDLNFIEKDLQSLINKNPNFSIEWGVIQNDEWDKDTKPYNIYSFDDFKKRWYYVTDKSKIKYALMRWIRHWCAKCDENIFCQQYAIPNPQPKDKVWDIQFKNVKNVDDIKFDVKSTRIPYGLSSQKDYYINHPDELIKWYYQHQSQESRKGYQNRLFVVHIPSDGRSETAVRCDFDNKRKVIENYFKSIESGDHSPYTINVEGYQVIADIVFVN